jgi:Zn-dependent M32 family carboxypeptidase
MPIAVLVNPKERTLMEQSLSYLREILSAHTENDAVGRRLYKRLSTHDFKSDQIFAWQLTQEESNYLNKVLEEAIEYSKQEQDEERARQLNEVYEQLFI